MENGVPFAVLAVIGLGIVFRVIAGHMDRERIEAYVRSNGGRIASIDWAPFGPGWFGEKSDRIYHVRFEDRAGDVHETHCKTSLTTGVYFTEDRIARSSFRPLGKSTPHESCDFDAIVAENTRLREELERLRRGDA